MRDYLIKENRKFWHSIKETLKQFDMESNSKISKDEQTHADMFASQIIGDISSSLAEFYESVSSANLPSHDIEQIANRKLSAFTSKAEKSIEYNTAKERDEFEIALIDGGHTGDTFALASKSLYNSLNQESNKMEHALDETITKITSFESAPTFETEQALRSN